MGEIAIEDMKFKAYHGLYDFEQKNGGEFSVSVYIDFDSEKVGKTDNVVHTINYEEILAITTHEMQITSKMIEHVAYRIVHSLQLHFKNIEQIKLRITKHQPPLAGSVGSVFFEIEKKCN